MEEYQGFPTRLPRELHMAARLKSVRTGVPLNQIIIDKLQEWVNEPAAAPLLRATAKTSRKAQKATTNG